MRIAMWSGPRNLSTAMMYAFGARPDFAVVDEPFYAAYLARTGIRHPMRDEVIASQDTDSAKVIAMLTGPIPGGKPHFYQKHMPHQMPDGFDYGWAREMRHVFLLRHPARVVASYAQKAENPTPEDLGFPQQEALFDRLAGMGATPLVIDSETIRADPAPALKALCAALGLPWDPAMLHWPAGGHPADGVWAAHWYGAIHRSTGFAGPEGPLPDLPEHYRTLARSGMGGYEKLRALALKI
ncbi:sulfotransferase family protein [Oceaniglobus roseus]|uniref:sulfotransferase-like domain-containing protein n=1 Tax=Oceaniglobus roseus TaxID=1737570 RepID=UPI000C7F46AA|nr:sulfotransferase family protein [Kandeliimicrobium roseum]